MLRLLLLAAACTGGGSTADAPASTGASDSADAAWMPTYEPAVVPAQWSADEALAALDGTLAGGFPAPFGMAETFAWFLDQGNDWCPGSETYLGPEALEGCAVEGWWYLGIGGYDLVEEPVDGGVQQQLFLLGDLEIKGPGAELAVGGHWDHAVTRTDELAAFDGELTGSWQSPGRDQEPWLSVGTSAWIAYSGTANKARGTVAALWLHGGLALGGQALDFQDLTWDDGDCAEQPSGAVGWQDPGLGWWHQSLPDCTGCGPLSHDGQLLQEKSCVDLAEYAGVVVQALAP